MVSGTVFDDVDCCGGGVDFPEFDPESLESFSSTGLLVLSFSFSSFTSFDSVFLLDGESPTEK